MYKVPFGLRDCAPCLDRLVHVIEYLGIRTCDRNAYEQNSHFVLPLEMMPSQIQYS